MFVSALVAVIAWTASVLLVVSGVTKLRRPQPAMRALAAARLPSGSVTVRALGLTEVLIGLAFTIRPGTVTGTVLALTYVGFAMFLLTLLRRPAEASTCGCLGRHEASPSRLHLGLDLVAAVAATAVAAGVPAKGFVQQAIGLGWPGIPFVLGVGLAAWLAVLAVIYVPGLFGSYAGRRA